MSGPPLSGVLPLSYAVEAMTEVTAVADPFPGVLGPLGVVAGFTVAALVLGAATLRRRTA